MKISGIISWLFIFLAFISIISVEPSVAGLSAARLAISGTLTAEEEGIEANPPAVIPLPATQAPDSINRLCTTGLLLIPESSNDRVMAFDPTTGALVDENLIPSDTTNLSTPINAILSSDGNYFLVSDQVRDVVLKYNIDGTYAGLFAPAGGRDLNILDNVRGITLALDGSLLVSVGGGANDDSIPRFDVSGNYTGQFVTTGAGGLNSPFDILYAQAGYLVAGITSDAIHKYDLTGNSTGNLRAIDTFPEQIAYSPLSGNYFVGNFSGTEEGVLEISPAGVLIGRYDPPALGGYRGVYELPDSTILTTNGGGVHRIDRTGALLQTVYSGVNARFIEFVKLDSSNRLCPITDGGAPPEYPWNPDTPYRRIVGPDEFSSHNQQGMFNPGGPLLRGTTVEYDFQGSRLEINSIKGPLYGSFKVYVDGMYLGEVDLFDPELTETQTVFTAYLKGGGTHIVTIKQNPSMPGISVNIQYFVIYR